MVLLLIANGVTLNVTGCGLVPLTPAVACATPVGPTCEPFGHAFGPRVSSVDCLPGFQPFVLILICLGAVILSCAAVCCGRLFFTVSTSLTAFGFFAVPALLGLTFTVTVDVGASARATLVLRNAAATPAAIRDLRKKTPP